MAGFFRKAHRHCNVRHSDSCSLAQRQLLAKHNSSLAAISVSSSEQSAAPAWAISASHQLRSSHSHFFVFNCIALHCTMAWSSVAASTALNNLSDEELQATMQQNPELQERIARGAQAASSASAPSSSALPAQPIAPQIFAQPALPANFGMLPGFGGS